jgi:hypothetical protein
MLYAFSWIYLRSNIDRIYDEHYHNHKLKIIAANVAKIRRLGRAIALPNLHTGLRNFYLVNILLQLFA